MTSYKWFTEEEIASWPEGHKMCRECQEVLPFDKFHKNKHTLFGYNTVCKDCRKPVSREKYSQESIEYRLWYRAKRRAKKAGCWFDITPSDIIVPDRCPMLDIPLEPGDGMHTSNSPSLDKIQPVLGYTKGNIQVISYRANMIKNNASARELRMIADYLDREYPEPKLELDSLTEPTVRWVE